MTERLPKAWAVQVPVYRKVVQPISGYVLGHKQDGYEWKLAIRIGGTEFITRKPYKNRAGAERAAKRYEE